MSVITLFLSRSRPKDRFESLIRPHIEGLYRFAYRLCQSQNEAEELVQSLLSKIHPKIEELEKLDQVRPWLARSLYNLYVDTYRKKRRDSSVFSAESVNDESASMEMTPADHADNEDMRKQLNHAIAKLNHDQRVVIMLHDAEGYTLSELENILQTPIGTLKSRLNRARNQLKSTLSEEPFNDNKRDKDMQEDNS